MKAANAWPEYLVLALAVLLAAAYTLRRDVAAPVTAVERDKPLGEDTNDMHQDSQHHDAPLGAAVVDADSFDESAPAGELAHADA